MRIDGPTSRRRRRHNRLETAFGGLMLFVGTLLNLTVVGLVLGMPLAVAGFSILTTPDPA